MPDRIVAGTWAAAAAATNGDVILERFPWDSLLAFLDVMRQVGVRIERLDSGEPCAREATVRVTSERHLRPAVITTQPHPGFPTDLQAQLMALLCLAEGNSVITEKIYPERHARRGTRPHGWLFTRQGPTVVVQGVKNLVGAPVMASDLRASACLVIAGLAARGTTTVNRVYHLDRGYVRMEDRLAELGANIRREDDREKSKVDLSTQPAIEILASSPPTPSSKLVKSDG